MASVLKVRQLWLNLQVAMMNKLIGVWGASGFGSEVLPLVRANYPNVELVFIDDAAEKTEFMGYPVLSFDDFKANTTADKAVVIAIANSITRETLTEKCESQGIEVFDTYSQNSMKMDNVAIGKGSIICSYTTITSNIKIGKSFHLNIYSYVGHDCIIGDYVTFAPSVKCNGNVHIEDHAYIGTGAILRQGTAKKPLVIGRGAVVGMGAVVTKNVPPGITVIGNPAKPLTKSALRN